MTHISKHQLFTLMFVFEVGSTTLFALGIDAKQDAWIVILIALIIGLGFIWIYTELQSAFPEKNYAEIIITILGKKLGVVLALLYAAEWLWHLARNVREFSELTLITLLPRTSIWVITSIFLCASLYTLLKGVEVLARASEIIMPILLVFSITVYVLVWISGNMDFKRLMPVLGGGIKPIIKTLPSVVMFPFGESFIFLMYWHYVNEKSSIRKTSMKAVFWSGILLCYSLIVDISVLGVKYTSVATIPLVETVRTINIGNIITNIDVIGIVIIFFGGFFKASVYLNGVVEVLTTVFKIKNTKLVLILFSLFLIWLSIAFEPSYAYHQWLFPFDTNYFAIIYSNIFPPMLLMIYWIKRKRIEF